MKGEADVPISLPGLRSVVKAIITEHVAEPMIGYDWMRGVGALLDCRTQRLILNRRGYKLHSRPGNGWARRVTVQGELRATSSEGVSTDVEKTEDSETKAKEKKKSSDLSEQAESTEESAGSSDEATVPKVRPVRTRRQPDRYTDF